MGLWRTESAHPSAGARVRRVRLPQLDPPPAPHKMCLRLRKKVCQAPRCHTHALSMLAKY